MKRGRRAAVEDRWHKSNGERTGRYGIGFRWRARYTDDTDKERAKMFAQGRCAGMARR